MNGDSSCFSSRDRLSGFSSTGTNMEGISYATKEHTVNVESSWQEDGDLYSNMSTRSPNADPEAVGRCIFYTIH
jgi:hypothetical protein